ncbi:hypothetical protein [Botryobacter ruber]|uniref:hypothetical protein n=1 Tax=Botryobacter ruber TaxID=2171629 RepID=UPI000E0A2715|nr:hypothetical protein [Botryobacter ruber]
MIRIFTVCCFLLLCLYLKTNAQTQASFTSGNTMLLAIESTSGMYEYSSNQLLVRYNEKTKKMECILDVTTLLPANNFSPLVIPQDIFFTAKYPEVLIEIDAPDQNIRAGSAAPQAGKRAAIIYFQGVPIEMTIPVTFTPDARWVLFSTTFDLLLPDYEVTVPAKYLPVLTGRLIFTIRNAHWVPLKP